MFVPDADLIKRTKNHVVQLRVDQYNLYKDNNDMATASLEN